MSRRNGDRRLRLVRKRMWRVPLKKFRQANHGLTILGDPDVVEDHWGTLPPLPLEKFYRANSTEGGAR